MSANSTGGRGGGWPVEGRGRAGGGVLWLCCALLHPFRSSAPVNVSLDSKLASAGPGKMGNLFVVVSHDSVL